MTATSPLHVLVVEDSEPDAILLLRELGREGRKVVHERVWTANDMENAIRSKPWDIIISDYSMPLFSGIDAYEIFKKSKLDIPFFMVSGTIGEDTAVEAMKRGIHDYFVKGNLVRLRPSIDRAINDARIRRKHREAEAALKQSEEKERLALELALQASRLKSEFLANISHEVRTPLNVVMGMTDILMESSLDESQKTFLQTIQKSCGALLKIISDILDFSVSESGKLELKVTDFSIRSIVENQIELMQAQAQAKGLSLGARIETNVPDQLQGDPVRIQQILLNLIGNAIKFTERGGVILGAAIEQIDSKTWLKCTISDTGIGVPEAQQKMIFQAFSQADGSLTRKYGGTGVGLSLCKNLVELMGGQIGVSSKVGKGSTFWFSLPVS